MKLDVTRAWKDEAYRESLSAEERCLLPENPAGEIELSEAELEAVYGGAANQGGAGGPAIQTNGYCTLLVCLVSVICLSGIICL
jgi:mersacidin/lichenicidin family type 2 lantibiotic